MSAFAFSCLGSGSKGNATLIRCEQDLFLVDCGFSVKYIEQCFLERNLDIHDLRAIFVTHEHSDHINGVAALARRYDLPVYASEGTCRSGKLDKVSKLVFLQLDRPLTISSEFFSDLSIMPVTVPHDARQACQFIFTYQQKKLGVLTDLGSVSSHVLEHFSGLDALLLEANHDVDMLFNGPYPYSLKQRVASDWGHLSNEQAASFLRQQDLTRLQVLVLGHISEKNNDVNLVKSIFDGFAEHVDEIHYASQSDGFAWIGITSDQLTSA